MTLQRLTEALRRCPVDAAFHLAWDGVTADHRNDARQITDNVRHSLELWSILRRSNCRTWIGVGSQAEHGLCSEAIDEQVPTRPVTGYGVAKLSLGMMSMQLCQMTGMRGVWIRLFAAYGPGDAPGHMIPQLVQALMRG